jgi:hypothetical protein
MAWREVMRTVGHRDMAMAQAALARLDGNQPSLSSVIEFG